MQQQKRNTFRKYEKVCNVNDISQLFRGKSLFFFPFKVGYIIEESQYSGVKVLCSVGKRYSKLAVCRNLMKRRSREAFRLSKEQIYTALEQLEQPKTVKIALIYVSKKEESYETVRKGVEKAVAEICKIVKEDINSTTSSAD